MRIIGRTYSESRSVYPKDTQMPRDGPTTLTQDLTHRETAHQRWADDGGSTPEPTTTPAAASGPLVRLVYCRPAGAVPFALSSAPPCTTILTS